MEYGSKHSHVSHPSSHFTPAGPHIVEHVTGGQCAPGGSVVWTSFNSAAMLRKLQILLQ